MSLRWSTRFRLVRHISRNLQRLFGWARVDPNEVRDYSLGRTQASQPASRWCDSNCLSRRVGWRRLKLGILRQLDTTTSRRTLTVSPVSGVLASRLAVVEFDERLTLAWWRSEARSLG